MKKGELLELTIESYAFEGKGISKIQKDENSDKPYVIFVNGAYPGERVNARLTKVKKSFAEAKTEEIIISSAERVAPKCKYFGTCGGCKQQDLVYSYQIKYKQEQVEDIFRRLGGFENYTSEPILPSDKIFFYRNKMEFSFAEKRWLTKEEISSSEEIYSYFALGLHIPKMFNKVLDIEECLLQSDESNQILNLTRKFFKERKETIYSTKTHSGYLRNLVIKQSHHTNDLMVNLVTLEDNERLFTEYTKLLINEIPSITTIINNINKKKAQVAIGDYEKVYYGSGFIYDEIGEYKFRISANSFFQTNTLQAASLYNVAVDFAQFSNNDIVYDLYSGAGTIAIYISKFVKEVHGFESVEPAIADAITNAELNGVGNFKPYLADLNKSFLPIVEKSKIPNPTLIIADPPRSGMNPKTVKDIFRLSPEKIVYVSCNPATQVRDIKLLSEGGYKLQKIKPVDMFPHTFHIENVALLTK